MSDNLFGVAKRVITTFEDDLDGSEAQETITFSLDGSEYEIDLNGAHAAALREAMNKYTAVARKSAGRARLTRRSGGSAGTTNSKAVRA